MKFRKMISFIVAGTMLMTMPMVTDAATAGVSAGVSKKITCSLSVVNTHIILLRVVCGLSDIIAIFCPIRLFINVDFPTFGLPITATKPDLKCLFSKKLTPF